MALWRDRRRSDILIRDNILANFKAVAEIKDKEEPVTKGDIDALRAEVMEVCTTLTFLNLSQFLILPLLLFFAGSRLESKI